MPVQPLPRTRLPAALAAATASTKCRFRSIERFNSNLRLIQQHDDLTDHTFAIGPATNNAIRLKGNGCCPDSDRRRDRARCSGCPIAYRAERPDKRDDPAQYGPFQKEIEDENATVSLMIAVAGYYGRCEVQKTADQKNKDPQLGHLCSPRFAPATGPLQLAKRLLGIQQSITVVFNLANVPDLV